VFDQRGPLHRSLAIAKINSTKVNNVGGARMSKSEGEHDKTKQIITQKKDFKSSNFDISHSGGK
jgi:hypothetical protein